MKKNVLVLGVLAFTAVLTLNCKKPGGDVKAAIASVNQAIGDAAGPLDSAADGAAAAKIIDGITAAMEGAMNKFPELKGNGEKPAEIKAEMDKGKEATEKFMTAFLKASEKFKDSAEFKAASEKFMTASAK